MKNMNQASCESIRLAAMAIADGESPLIPAAEIELHLGQCPRCRSEVEQLNTVVDLLNGQRRGESNEKVWGEIADRLGRGTARPMTPMARMRSDHWLWLLLLGLSLVGCRIVVAVSDWEPGLWGRLAPVLLVIAVFGLLRENPFKVNPGLQVQSSLRGNL